MIEVYIKRARSADTVAAVSLPATLYEIPINRYVNFATTVKQSTDPDAPLVRLMAEAVSHLCGVGIESLFEAEVLGSDFDLAKSQTISSLFTYGCNLVGMHEPKAHSRGSIVEIGGQSFVIPTITVDALVGLEGRLSVIEAIEAHEVRRKTREKIETFGDPDGSNWLSEYLYLLAVLLRKPNEYLPLDDDKRGQFLKDRAHGFFAIDAGTALDVDFFLLSTLLSLNKTLPLVGSFALSAMYISGQGKKGRRKWKQRPGPNKRQRTPSAG